MRNSTSEDGFKIYVLLFEYVLFYVLSQVAKYSPYSLPFSPGFVEL